MKKMFKLIDKIRMAFAIVYHKAELINAIDGTEYFIYGDLAMDKNGEIYQYLTVINWTTMKFETGIYEY